MITKSFNDEYYIDKATKLANIAGENGDIPVGCLIVYNENKKNKKMCEVASGIKLTKDNIVATAYNKRNKNKK